MAESKGFEDAALARILAEVDPMSEAAAAMMGMPPGGKRYSEHEQLEMWNASPISDPRVRVEAMIELWQAGKSEEEITDAIYPQRRRLIATSHGKAAEQIKYARDMKNLMNKRAAEAGMQMPEPAQEGAGPQVQPEGAVGSDPAPAPTMAPSPATPMPQSPLDRPFSLMGG